ncbi:MAG TPA: PqqD family protein [Vicinamibacteria bacterium]|nr:PqqD family protein [Vicinamibacteria bacterium]
MKPNARADGLVVQDLADETLVYDLERHKAHCLNRAAAAVWRLCDGKRDEAALARLLARDLGTAAEEDVVRLALRDLSRARLLQEPLAAEVRVSRRRLLRRLGQAVALPVVVSIVSPTAVQAATCRMTQPIQVSACNASNPNALGCCCTNRRICASLGVPPGGCNGAAC